MSYEPSKSIFDWMFYFTLMIAGSLLIEKILKTIKKTFIKYKEEIVVNNH